MSVRDLIPWNRERSQVPAVFRDDDARDPFLSLHREMNRLFDDVFRGFDSRLPTFGRTSAFGGGWPNVEVSDNEKEIRVTAEVAGLEEKDRRFSERFYGRFERRIPFGYEIDDDKASADFRNGVLTVTLPKCERAQAKAKRIAINGNG